MKEASISIALRTSIAHLLSKLLPMLLELRVLLAIGTNWARARTALADFKWQIAVA